MNVHLLIFVLAVTTLYHQTTAQPACVLSAEEQAELDAKIYLAQYGYLPQPVFAPGQPDTRNVTKAIIQFQRFAGLNETGILDNETLTQFQKPRCGLPDVSVEDESAPGNFGTSAKTWTTTNLKYRIDIYTRDLSNSVIRQKIQAAWQIWADVTPLTFTEVGAGQRADFVVKFQGGDHGDGYAFDGRGGILAHAFYPTSGKCHFDDDETWTAGTSSGINLLVVAVHEFGHALGLKHSDVSGAVMLPFYPGYQGSSFKLGSDDVQGIQSLYGKNPGTGGSGSGSSGSSGTGSGSSGSGSGSSGSGSGSGGSGSGSGGSGSGSGGSGSGSGGSGDNPPVAACSGKFDSVVKTRDGTLYGFTDGYAWDLTGRLNSGSANAFLIKNTFGTDITNPQAAVTVDGKTYIFRGCRVLEYVNTDFLEEYLIGSKFPGLSCNIFSAYTAEDGHSYFFLGKYYYKFQGFTFIELKSIDNLGWVGLPSALSDGFDAISESGNRNNDVYIFLGKQYWKLRQADKTFYNGYPRDIKQAWLTNC